MAIVHHILMGKRCENRVFRFYTVGFLEAPYV